jgi:hypothetical protein
MLIFFKQSSRADCTDRQIHHAAQHPRELDLSQASAVEARILLDLRLGAAFTRMQTCKLQPLFQQITGVVSYGERYSELFFFWARLNASMQARVNFLRWVLLCRVLIKFRPSGRRPFGTSTWRYVMT